MDILGCWAKPTGTSLIWHIHDYIGKRPIMAGLMKKYEKKCAVILVNSESVRNDLKQIGCDERKLRLFRNATDLNRFSPVGPKADLDTLAHLPEAKSEVLRVGLPGTFARWKGQKVFLKAVALLPTDLPLRAYVIGGPIYETTDSQFSLEELQSFAKDLGIQERVGFTGYLEDIPAVLRALDIVVHTSNRAEPFGLVLVEAMACGRPVIASKAGGPEEIVVEGENGLFYMPGDERSLADRILQLANSPGLRKKLGETGKRTVEEQFNASQLAERIAPIYQEALGMKT
jgi:glycosyltransferase involved in cell wall biosynthesis